MYIYVYIYIYIYVYIWACVEDLGFTLGAKMGTCFGLYTILFCFKALLWESIILYCPSHLQCLPYCITIARSLRNIRPSPPTPSFYAMHNTILVMAISYKGQNSLKHCEPPSKRGAFLRLRYEHGNDFVFLQCR